MSSPTLDPTTGSCLQFWYNMNGRTMGTLNVYTRRQGVLGNPVWTRSGNQGVDWEVGQVTLQSALPFTVTFEGIIGNTAFSDMAIDDIFVQPGACPGEGNCDFEGSLCTWKNTATGDNFDWLQGQGRRLSGFTGQVLDHTLNTRYGTYMYINSAAPRQSGDKAWLVSPTFSSSATRCLTMWYKLMNNAPLNINMQLVGASPVNKLTITQVEWCAGVKKYVVCVCACVRACMHACVRACMCVCLCVCACAWACVSARICTCLCVQQENKIKIPRNA